MKKLISYLILAAAFHGGASWADDDDHAKGDAHEESEEQGPRIGADKGILQADQHKGFKLSPEAVKNFELKTQKLTGSGPWRIPKSALLLAGEERNVFRVRGGFYKRIDFTETMSSDSMLIQSKDLKADDEVVVMGLGFLRIAEISAFGGAPEGHSH